MVFACYLLMMSKKNRVEMKFSDIITYMGGGCNYGLKLKIKEEMRLINKHLCYGF